MPDYEVTSDVTGRSIVLTGDEPPTKQDVDRAFAVADQAQQAASGMPMSSLSQGPEPKSVFGRAKDWLTGNSVTPIAPDEARTTGERIQAEGPFAATFTAPKERRESWANTAEKLVDPLTSRIFTPRANEVAKGVSRVAGMLAADTLTTPGGLMTLGAGTLLKELASAKELSDVVRADMSAADLLHAADVSKTASTALRVGEGALGATVGGHALANIPGTYRAVTDPNVPLKQKAEALASELIGLGGGALALTGAARGRATGSESLAADARTAAESEAALANRLAAQPQPEPNAIQAPETAVDPIAQEQADLRARALQERFGALVPPEGPTATERVAQIARAEEGGIVPVTSNLRPEPMTGPLKTAEDMIAARGKLGEQFQQEAKAEDVVNSELPSIKIGKTAAEVKDAAQQLEDYLAKVRIFKALEEAKTKPIRMDEPAPTEEGGIVPVEEVSNKRAEPQEGATTFGRGAEDTASIGPEGTPAGETELSSISDKLVAWLNSRKVETAGKVFDITQGVPVYAYNFALDAAIAGVKGGAKLADSVDEAVRKAKEKFPKIDEEQLRGALHDSMLAPKPIYQGPGDKTESASAKPASQSTGILPDTGETKVRKFSQRAATSSEVPPVARAAIAQSDRRFYTAQRPSEIAKEATTLPSTDLVLDAANVKSNTRVLSTLELARREFAKGTPEGDRAGADFLQPLSEDATTYGQLINQLKMLKGVDPDFYVKTANSLLTKNGYDPLRPNQVAEIRALSQAAIKAHNEAVLAEDAFRADPTEKNSRVAYAAEEADDKATGLVLQKLNRVQPNVFLKKYLSMEQGNVLTPMSQERNIADNAMIAFLDMGMVRPLAAMVDMFRHGVMKAAGKESQREISFSPLQQSVAYGKGFAEATPKALKILTKGIESVPELSAEHSKGAVDAFRAMKDLWNYYVSKGKNLSDMPTKTDPETGRTYVPWEDLSTKWMEASPPGVTADLSLRGLNAGDLPPREGARAAIITDFAKLRGLTPEQTKIALKKPDAFFNAKDSITIEQETLKSVLQQKNAITDWINKGEQTLQSTRWGTPLWFALRQLGLFKNTPINSVALLLEYTPVGFAKAVRDFQDGNYRAGEISAARATLGLVAGASLVWMYQKGIYTPPLDAQDDKVKTRQNAGQIAGGNTINMSALNRARKGESTEFRPGDRIVNVGQFGQIGGIMTISGAMLRSLEKSTDAKDSTAGTVASLIGSGVLSTGSYALNQKFLQGVTGFIDALRKGDFNKFGVNVTGTLLSGLLPNTLSTITKTGDQYKKVVTTDAFGKSMVNQINQKLDAVGLKIPNTENYKDLPTYIDAWGERIPETPYGANPYIYHFLDITQGKDVPDSKMGVGLYNLWRNTKSDDVYPQPPSRDLSIANNKLMRLDDHSYEALQIYTGMARRMLTEALFDNPKFGPLPDAAKLAFLKAAYEEGSSAGKFLFWNWAKKNKPEIFKLKPKAGQSSIPMQRLEDTTDSTQ